MWCLFMSNTHTFDYQFKFYMHKLETENKISWKVCTVGSRKRAHGRCTLLCTQTRGWADICNIAAFYHEIAPMFTLSQPTTGQSCTPTNPPSTAGSHEVLDCWWWRIIWVHRTVRMVAMNRRSVCNRVQQTAKAHLRNSSGSGSRRNTVGHAPREIWRVCWYFQLVRNNTITCKVRDKRQRTNIRPGKGLKVPCMRLLVE